MNKVGKYEYNVEPFQEDFTGHLSWAVLGNTLLKCASFHANEYGFGAIKKDGVSYHWVLSRMVIEINEMPSSGEYFTIETWVRRIYRQFTDRCFAITGNNGNVIGYAYTIWAMINMETREAVDLEKMIHASLFNCIETDKPCPVKEPGRIRLKELQLYRSVNTYYSDIDINNHVNSIRYLEHIMNLFPKKSYEEKRIKRVEFAYSSECYCDEPLSFYMQQTNEDIYAIEVRKNAGKETLNGELTCRCELTFENYK